METTTAQTSVLEQRTRIYKTLPPEIFAEALIAKSVTTSC